MATQAMQKNVAEHQARQQAVADVRLAKQQEWEQALRQERDMQLLQQQHQLRQVQQLTCLVGRTGRMCLKSKYHSGLCLSGR